MLPSKFKNFLKLFLANILVFLAVAIVIEVGGQIYAYFHPAYKVIPFAPHPVMGWRFIPNSDHIVTGDYWYAREFSAEVKINSHGFRDLERSVEKDKNTVRIALLGDSMISARQVEFEKTAGQLLEKRLNKEFGAKTGKKYEVLNFGVDGYGVDQMFLNWDTYAYNFKPDYVFLYIFEKNYLRTISTTWCQKGFFGIDGLGKGKCLNIRPLVTLKLGRAEILSVEERENFVNDFLYINHRELEGLKINQISYIGKLPFQIFLPKEFQKFVDQQQKFIKKEMSGERILKMGRKSFLMHLMSDMKGRADKFVKNNENERAPYYGSGDKIDFPSWDTTNWVNLKTLQVLGGEVLNSKSDFIIVDSFQFHNESIPPTQLASNLLSNLSQSFRFGYIKLYEGLNESREKGNSPRWKYDLHLNEIGNEIFANSMFNYLETKLN